MTNSLMVKLGFGQTMNWDGVDVSFEHGVPTGTGFGINFDKIALHTLNGQLFHALPVDFSVETLTNRYTVLFYGNMQINPRSLAKVIEITTP